MKHLLLTGDLHVGKTTVCRKVVELARQRGYSVRGFLTTTNLDQEGQRLGLVLLDLVTGEHRELARVDCDYGGPSVGPFRFDPAVLHWGYDIVARAVAQRCDLLVVDEIGRLELEQNAGFGQILDLLTPDMEVRAAAGGSIPRSLLVVRSGLLDALRRRVPELEYVVFEVTVANRDAAPAEIAQLLWPS